MDQRSVAACPFSIRVGSAEKLLIAGFVTVGAGAGRSIGGGGGGGAGGGTFFLHPAADISNINVNKTLLTLASCDPRNWLIL